MLVEAGVVIIAFLSLFVGQIVNKVAKEELKPGKPYFLWGKRVLLLLLVIVLLFYTSFEYTLIIPFVIGFGLAYVLHLRYLYLGFAITSALMIGTNALLIIAAIILVYGLFFSTDPKWQHYNLFYFLPLLLFLVPKIAAYSSYLAAFAAGLVFLRE